MLSIFILVVWFFFVVSFVSFCFCRRPQRFCFSMNQHHQSTPRTSRPYTATYSKNGQTKLLSPLFTDCICCLCLIRLCLWTLVALSLRVRFCLVLFAFCVACVSLHCVSCTGTVEHLLQTCDQFRAIWERYHKTVDLHAQLEALQSQPISPSSRLLRAPSASAQQQQTSTPKLAIEAKQRTQDGPVSLQSTSATISTSTLIAASASTSPTHALTPLSQSASAPPKLPPPAPLPLPGPPAIDHDSSAPAAVPVGAALPSPPSA